MEVNRIDERVHEHAGMTVVVEVAALAMVLVVVVIVVVMASVMIGGPANVGANDKTHHRHTINTTTPT